MLDFQVWSILPKLLEMNPDENKLNWAILTATELNLLKINKSKMAAGRQYLQYIA